MFKVVSGRRSPKRPRPRRKNRTGLIGRIVAGGDRLAFNWKVREALYRHLASQVGNGVPVEDALDGFRPRLKRKKKLSSEKIVADVARRMRDGSTLAGALSKWIPGDELGMIASGELSGTLPKSLDIVIEARRRTNRVSSALRSAFRRPLIYALGVYAMLLSIGIWVIPQLEQALPQERATGLSSGLFTAGAIAASPWAAVPVVLVIAAVGCIAYSLPRWTGRYRVVAENYFPYSFYRDSNGFAWLMGFTALLGAGVPDVEILERQKEQTTPWMKERLHAIWWRLQNGKSLSDALLEKGRGGMPPFGFPNPDVVDDISSLYGFPDFHEKIAVLAFRWAEELEANTLAFAESVGFWMEIVMYVVMGLLMVSINSMTEQLGHVPGM